MINAKELLSYTENLTILFAEDHTQLRENTTETLKHFFKKVDSTTNGEDAYKLYKDAYNNGQKYDLLLTDIEMPKLNGIELIEKVYEIEPSQSVIVLSAYDDSAYLLSLINMGIEQFIKKPISYEELIKVLYNVTKQQKFSLDKEKIEEEVEIGSGFSYNFVTKIFTQNDNKIYLTKYEIIFLELLLKSAGKVYSNEKIVTHFNSMSEEIDPQNIRKLVSKLRKKLPLNSLESIYGVGYRMISTCK